MPSSPAHLRRRYLLTFVVCNSLSFAHTQKRSTMLHEPGRFIVAGFAVFLLTACSHFDKEYVSLAAEEWATLPKDFNGVMLEASSSTSAPVVTARGLANAATKVKASRQTRYPIGSISKWLTSIMALRLVDAGVLSLDLPIARWLPDLPELTKEKVTLRHLLSNVSGIPNGVMDAYRQNPAMALRDVTAAEAARLYGSGRLTSEPGSTWDYSLTNWVLVRAILEAASGKPFELLANDEIVVPLKLTGTGVPSGMSEDIPGAAIGYETLIPLPKPKRNPIPAYAAASGTFYSTVDDLRTIAAAIYNPGYLSTTSLDELTKVVVPDEGYALGGRIIDLSEGSGVRILWETGETGSFRALLAYEPRSGACVVIFNNTGVPPQDIGSAAKSALRRMIR